MFTSVDLSRVVVCIIFMASLFVHVPLKETLAQKTSLHLKHEPKTDAVFNQQPLFRVIGNLRSPVPRGGLSTCLVMSFAQCAIIRSDHRQSMSSDLEREQKRRSPLYPHCCDITPSQCVDNRNKTPGVCHLDSIVSGVCV